jgi:vancomycin resistance protein VanW
MIWLFGGIQFAHKGESILNHEHFSHSTPLLRELKDVDMYLQHNKITNLIIAILKVDKVIIHPGEMFSFWKLIGKPTKRKGYLKGMILKNGSFTPGTGGGLCQLSNLIYWMTIHTPLTVVERHRHSYDVFPDVNRTQPFGSGATCFYNYGDLMIANNTEHPFQLRIEISENDLIGAWDSSHLPDCKYEPYEKEHLIQPEYWGGYSRHNSIYRRIYNLDGLLIKDEFITENHAMMMYSPLLP